MFKATAIVSLYNSMEFVKECLQDLVDQSLFKRGLLEILVIDSNSPQNEKTVVEHFVQQYPGKIVYHRTDQRETLYQAWNRALSMAKGEYLTNANSDDRHHPEALEIMSMALDKHREVDLVYSDVFESTVANQTFFENSKASRYKYHSFFAPNSLLFYQFGCQPIWRSSLHSRIGGFSTELKAAGDWEFCIRFALAGLRALHIPLPLGSFLNRPTSISSQDSTSSREQMLLRDRYLSLDNIILLYLKEGWKIDTPQAKAKILTDFAIRASNMALPWTPGKIYQDPSATLISCLGAYELMKEDPRANWNLGVALHSTAHKQEATRFLELGTELGDPRIAESLGAVKRGEMVSLSMVHI